jgi:hypothetical protein
MIQSAFAVIDISLARPSLEKNRNGDKWPLFLYRPPKRCGGTLSHVPLALKKPVMTLTGGYEITADIELITIDANLAVDERATTGMIG